MSWSPNTDCTPEKSGDSSTSIDTVSPTSDDTDGYRWMEQGIDENIEAVFEIIILICNLRHRAIELAQNSICSTTVDWNDWWFVIPSSLPNHNRDEQYSTFNQSPRLISKLLEKGSSGYCRADEYGDAFYRGIGSRTSKVKFALNRFRQLHLNQILPENIVYQWKKFVCFNPAPIRLPTPTSALLQQKLPALCADALDWYNGRLVRERENDVNAITPSVRISIADQAAPRKCEDDNALNVIQALAFESPTTSSNYRSPLRTPEVSQSARNDATDDEAEGASRKLKGEFDEVAYPDIEPLLRYIEAEAPKKGVHTVRAKRDGQKLSWDEMAKPLGSKQVRREKERTETFLHGISGGKKAHASQFCTSIGVHCECCTDQNTSTPITASSDLNQRIVTRNVGEMNVPPARTDQDHIETMIGNLSSFFDALYSKGTRPIEAQEALDAIHTALSFSKDGELPVGYQNYLVQALGTSTFMVQKGSRMASKLTERGKYHHEGRKLRKDAILELLSTGQLVMQFSHLFSRLDSNTGFIYVKEPGGERKKHKICIWDGEFSVSELYRKFQLWDEYTRWRLTNDNKEIKEGIFRVLLCPCVKKPTGKSCVDIWMSSIEERQKAISAVLKSDVELHSRLKGCNCEYHREQRGAHEAAEEAGNEESPSAGYNE